MPDERVFDHDPLTGMTTMFSKDEETGDWWFRYIQDVAPILEQNKASQNEGLDKSKDLWHAAHIPDTVILEWRTKYGIDLYDRNHAKGVERLLNSNEYRYLRVKNFII